MPHNDAPPPAAPLPDAPRVRLASLPGRLPILEHLAAEAIRDPVVAPCRRRAQFTFFLGAEPAESAGYEGQLEAVGRCLEWFVFDYVIPDLDATPAQHWLATHAAELSPQDHADAADCLRFVLGLFEIDRIHPDRGFDAIDLLRPPLAYSVREHLVTRELQPGQLLLGRLFPHRSAYALSGMAALMEPHATRQLRQLIADGKLLPAAVLPTLDGLELENLVGRSVHDLPRTLDKNALLDRLQRFLNTAAPAALFPQDLRQRLAACSDPLRLTAEIAAQFHLSCRHEIDFLHTLIAALLPTT